MNRDISFVLSLSVGVSAIIGLVRFKNVEKAYRPFLYYVFAALINEIISFWLPLNHRKYVLIDLNLFTLFEYLHSVVSILQVENISALYLVALCIAFHLYPGMAYRKPGYFFYYHV